ncbi:queuine tRNA-ribosyltransferase [Candidatus Shapirobacteria bacterium]|nr:MAG: queuine tRNA-ribosyltransferase [Candidatus Shapirobacteria bacterium]
MTKPKSPKFFKTTKGKKYPLPVFFPDATQAFIKNIDPVDIKNTHTPGILVNTYHLRQPSFLQVIEQHQSIGNFMSWSGAIISDSGGFQVMSLAKKFGGPKAISDRGVKFKPPNQPTSFFTPQQSIRIQMQLKTDMVVVLDDFTDPQASYQQAKESVRRTILWAKICKKEFDKICQQQKNLPHQTPYLLAVVQGGKYLDLRLECTRQLVKIGFDGLGYGGWPLDEEGNFNLEIAQLIANNAPKNYLLYALGIGKPEDIVACVKLGWHIFDCVIPTRDARHRRLYTFNTPSISKIDINQKDFYSYFVPTKTKHQHNTQPVSQACDCHLCQNYSQAYLHHLFKTGDSSAYRLATIHNLRFYSILMEKLQQLKNDT